MPLQSMKIREIINAFSRIGSEEAEREAYLTVEQLFGVSYAALISDRQREFDEKRINEVIEKRKNKIPLQYIFGEWYFMGTKFLVSPDCLIPRQDTEVLVENALKSIKAGGRIADLCTGSGCIGISVLLNRPDISHLTLVDISDKALSVAIRNADLHNVSEKCTFKLADVRDDVLCGTYDAILSNPPYISSKDIDSLSDEVKKEPKIALDGGEDGLDIIAPIVYNSSQHLSDGGILMIEFGYDQKESMEELLCDAVNKGLYSSYRFYYDYGNNIRACHLTK